METIEITVIEEISTVAITLPCVVLTIAPIAPSNPAVGDLWIESSE